MYKNNLKGYTKREILKFVASVSDPLGVLDPFTVSGEILLQEL